jgi:hypothetical protein
MAGGGANARPSSARWLLLPAAAGLALLARAAWAAGAPAKSAGAGAVSLDDAGKQAVAFEIESQVRICARQGWRGAKKRPTFSPSSLTHSTHSLKKNNSWASCARP